VLNVTIGGTPHQFRVDTAEEFNTSDTTRDFRFRIPSAMVTGDIVFVSLVLGGGEPPPPAPDVTLAEPVTLASLDLTPADTFPGRFDIADAASVTGNVTLATVVNRQETPVQFTRVFGVTAVGGGSAASAYLLAVDAADSGTGWDGAIYNLLGNLEFAQREGNILNGVTLPSGVTGYWGDPFVGNTLNAGTGTVTSTLNGFMFGAGTAGTYTLTVYYITLDGTVLAQSSVVILVEAA
jgi:hypothetical protein